jgi:glucokinase
VSSVGIDVGGTKCLGVSLGPDGSVVAERRVATPDGSGAIVEAVSGLVEDLVPEPDGELSVGVGLPGLVDIDGVLRFAPHLPDVVNLPLGQLLRERFRGARVRVENDASCAGWAERELGAAHGADHAVVLTLGTGVGGGIIAEGRLLRGAHGYAGEIGHMVVVAGGPRCPCGQQGCWELYASGSGLGELGREAARAGRGGRTVELAGGDPADVRGEHVTAAAAEGDAEAVAVMARFGWWVAVGLLNLANVFDPELFVLGGGLAESGEIVLGPTRAALGELVDAVERRPDIPVVVAELGGRAGAVGAALLARQEGRP